MLERPEAVSHYKNADRSVRDRFALRKCRPQLNARESACFTEGKRPRIQAPPGDPPHPPLRQHKNVTFRISASFPRVLQRKRDLVRAGLSGETYEEIYIKNVLNTEH